MDLSQVNDIAEVPAHQYIYAMDRGSGNVLSIYLHLRPHDSFLEIKVGKPSCLFVERYSID